VEFALILPVLLLLVGGVVDFGRLYFQQAELSNAARDGARLAAMGSASYPPATVKSRAEAAALPIVATATVVACGAPGSTATVTVTKTVAFDWSVLGFLPGLPSVNPTGKAAMTCPWSYGLDYVFVA
jgi:Flp pilus assembly protein TadG